MPLTPVLDDFNRADAGNLGANWTDLLNGLDIISNMAGAPSAADHLTFYSAVQFAANQEAYVTMPTVPAAGGTAGIYVRLQNTGSVATIDGYAAILIRQAGTDIVQVYRIDNAVGTQLGANISQEFVNGEGMLLRARGTTLTVIHISGAGVETVIGERTDATYNLAGYTALACNATAVRFDNFGAGAVDIVGTLSVTQAGNTLASTGTAPIVGAASITQASNTLASTGASDVAGTLNTSQANNTLASTGVAPIVGTASITQANNTLASTGAGVIVGELNITQAGNTLSSTGTSQDAITGTLSVTQDSNALSATGAVAIIGTLTVTQSGNTVVSSGAADIAGTLNATQADNTVIASGSSVIVGSLSATQSNNTLSSGGAVAIVGTLVITQADNTLSSSETPLVPTVEYDALEVDSRNLLLTTAPRKPVWATTDRDALDYHTIEARTSLLTVAPRNRELKV